MVDLSVLPSRILEKISFEPMSGCWIWTASLNHDGYGMVWDGTLGKHTSAHRLVYRLLQDDIDQELELDHLCRLRCCVNPDHMQQVSHRENVLRGVSVIADRAQSTHCKHGHLLSGDNLRMREKTVGYTKYQTRVCRECNKIASKRWKDEHGSGTSQESERAN